MDEKRRRRRLRELGVGITVLVGLTLLGLAILIIGKENQLFVSRVGFATIVQDASGLRVGSPVTMNGVRIGTVDGITLPRNPRGEGIKIHLDVDEDYAARIRRGTEARLTIAQIVANEKVVALSPGEPAEPQLPPESIIPASGGSRLIETGRDIAETVAQMTDDLREILRAIRNGDGFVGKAIVDPEFSRETMTSVTASAAATARILDRIDRGEGLIGRLMADEGYGAQVAQDLARASASLAATAQRVEAGQGLLGSVTEPGEGETFAADLAAAAAGLKDVSGAIGRGEGIAGMLATDNERGRRIAANLDEAAADLASILSKIESGQGTLGLLVNDRGLYDGAQNVITGARNNKFMSWLLRRLHDSGAKERERQTPDGTGAPPATGTPGTDDGYSGPGAVGTATAFLDASDSSLANDQETVP